MGVAENPYAWVTLVAGLLAGSLAVATMVVRDHHRPERARRTKSVVAILVLTAAVAAASAAFFFIDVDLVDPAVLGGYAAGAFLILFFMFRFPVAIGTPLLVMAITFWVLVQAAIVPWRPLRGQTVETLAVLGVVPDRLALESIDDEIPFTLPADSFGPVVELLTLHPVAFWFGPLERTRLVGLLPIRRITETGAIEERSAGSVVPLPKPEGEPSGMASPFADQIRSLPFMAIQTMVGFSERMIPLRVYDIRIEDGVVTTTIRPE